MANVKISGLTNKPSPVGTDLIEIEEAGGTSYKATLAATVTSLHPTFRAYTSGDQTLTDSTAAKISFDTETFDQGADYDNATNYRWTPGVSGYYLVNCQLFVQEINDGGYLEVRLYKNGASVTQARIQNQQGTDNTNAVIAVSDIINCNGSTDYIEAYGYYYDNGLGGTTDVVANSKLTFFWGTRVA